MDYKSTLRLESREVPGVAFTISRVSFCRRMELARRVRETIARIECFEAGQDAREKLDAAILSAEVDRVCILWGLAGLEGLELDGQPATPEDLVERGPEPLCREVLAAIRRELGLSDEERKN